jgi:hypothetical protein
LVFIRYSGLQHIFWYSLGILIISR